MISTTDHEMWNPDNILPLFLKTTEDPRHQLTALDDEIARVEQTLSRLRSLQPVLRRDINRLHSPMLNRLPTELVSEIFIHCIPEQSDLIAASQSEGVSPLFLGTVCSAWRQIAWNTPTLWTSPNLLLSKLRLRTQAELLEEWIGRSGDLLLTLKLHCGTDDDRVTNIPHTLFQIILGHASRWKGIDLQVPTAYYEDLSAPGASFSSLQSLIINPSGGQGDRSHVLNWSACTPKLRNISLFSVYLNTVRVRWDNITRVHAKAFYIDECIEFMRRTPNLEYCNFYSVIRGDDGHNPPADLIEVPHLRTLSLVTERTVDAGRILTKLDSPQMTGLTFDVAERSFDVSSFKQFVTASAQNLTQLSILRASITSADVADILPLIPTVTDFKLNVIEARGVCMDSTVMNMLKPSRSGKCVLPNMTRFEYVGPFSFSWPLMIGVLVARRGLKVHPSSATLVSADAMRDSDRLLFPSQNVAILTHAAIRVREAFDDIDPLDRHLLQLVRQLAGDGLDLSVAAATVECLDYNFFPVRVPSQRVTPNNH
ncbi:hypothetical protein FA15DRAFT_662339 [Coprinopsis marcescibilis]|uniref:Uncharacterized protein n=1 Tax=Coprinopsis marcescibilis TaxID=230819 RepID=A0A5C3LNT7_COPMA|nr:hypothetical protein FA15DRAFT_662339 [Coprinopsis marcescibilis]